jgi:hypothetical protein
LLNLKTDIYLNHILVGFLLAVAIAASHIFFAINASNLYDWFHFVITIISNFLELNLAAATAAVVSIPSYFVA